MMEKLASFILTLGLIAWEVLDIVHGNHPTLSWILIGIFTLMGLFELGAIAGEGKRTVRTAGDAPDLPEKEIFA